MQLTWGAVWRVGVSRLPQSVGGTLLTDLPRRFGQGGRRFGEGANKKKLQRSCSRAATPAAFVRGVAALALGWAEHWRCAFR